MRTHKWSYPIDCVGCGQQGTVTVAEDSRPPFADEARREFAVTAGFQMRLREAPVEVECLSCGALTQGRRDDP